MRAPQAPRPRRRGLVTALLTIGVGALSALVAPALWARRSSAGRLLTLDQALERTLPAVAVVLGAGVAPDGTPSLFLQGRLDTALALYESGQVTVIVVSGDHREGHHDEPGAMARYLIAHGVPSSQVVLDPAGFDTYDTCSRASRIYGIDRFVLISQTYHLPRALGICRGLGLDVVGVGDETVRRYARVWRTGALREIPANVKAVYDVLSRRDPTLGPPRGAVYEALHRNAGG